MRGAPGIAVPWTAHAKREHQHGLVVLDEDDAAVLDAVLGDEPDAAWWTCDLGDPLGHDAEPGAFLVHGAEEHIDECVAEAVHESDGQMASLTAAISTPAAAAATPFLSASFSKTRER